VSFGRGEPQVRLRTVSEPHHMDSHVWLLGHSWTGDDPSPMDHCFVTEAEAVEFSKAKARKWRDSLKREIKRAEAMMKTGAKVKK
jgi:hypothetical protein